MVKRIQRLLLLILLIMLRIFSKKREATQYKLIKETEMGLVYELTLPVVSTFDVVKRVIRVDVNGVVDTITLNRTDTTATLKPVPDNSVVKISVSDVDDAGNESGYGEELVFTALDTIPPARPGMPQVTLVGETPDAIATPAPEPVPDQTPVDVVEPSIDPVEATTTEEAE